MNVAAGPTHLMRARRWRVRVPLSAPRTPLRLSAPLLALATLVLAVQVHVQPARAVILPATTIDGPSPDIVGFGGVAMAEERTVLRLHPDTTIVSIEAGGLKSSLPATVQPGSVRQPCGVSAPPEAGVGRALESRGERSLDRDRSPESGDVNPVDELMHHIDGLVDVSNRHAEACCHRRVAIRPVRVDRDLWGPCLL
jgi:hypothetical protein